MPHQCTNCGHTFADGSKEMLSGCPGCGGNTFQFHPKGTEIPDEPPETGASPPEPDGGGTANTVGRAATRVRDFVGSDGGDGSGAAAGTPHSRAGPPEEPEPGSAPDPSAPWPDDLDDGEDGGDGEDAEIIDADARREADAADAEGLAQASARGEVAGPDDVAAGADPPAPGGGDPPRGGEEAAASAGAAGPDPPEGRVASEPSDDDPDIEELRQQLNDQFESIRIVEPGQYELNLMELFDREEYIIALQENGRYVIQVPENWMGDRPGD